MTQDQILGLVNAVEDMHDLCLLQVGIFCGPCASEVMGLQMEVLDGGRRYCPTGRPTKGSSSAAG
jgi:integrase